MKLYSWIQNERQIHKTQGGNKVLEFTLDYEENGQDYRCNTSEHQLVLKFMLDEKGEPVIYIWGNNSYLVIDKR